MWIACRNARSFFNSVSGQASASSSRWDLHTVHAFSLSHLQHTTSVRHNTSASIFGKTDATISNVKSSNISLKPQVVLYDGVCRLCNAGVNWVIQADKQKRISFCAVQSEAAEPYLLISGLTREDVLRRFLFVEGPRQFSQASTAALRICLYLPFPYPILSTLLAIPAPLRDAMYDFVAKRRYRWFGQFERCALPTADVLSRFIDREEIIDKLKKKGKL